MKRFIVNITQKIEYIVEKLPWTYGFFESYYEKVVENEIKLADIKPSDEILCIGGGPCPCTAIELHRKTGAKVCVIDNDEDVIDVATKNIKNLNLSEFITVKYQEGSKMNVNDFSVVHIALQVNPKNAVFQRIVNNSRPGTKVLVRISNKKFSKLYSLMKMEAIKIDKKIYHKKKNLDHTLLHITTGGSNEEVLETNNSITPSSVAI